MEPQRPRRPTLSGAISRPTAKRKRSSFPTSSGGDVPSNGVSESLLFHFDSLDHNTAGFNDDIEVIDLDSTDPLSSTPESNVQNQTSAPPTAAAPLHPTTVGTEVIELDNVETGNVGTGPTDPVASNLHGLITFSNPSNYASSLLYANHYSDPMTSPFLQPSVAEQNLVSLHRYGGQPNMVPQTHNGLGPSLSLPLVVNRVQNHQTNAHGSFSEVPAQMPTTRGTATNAESATNHVGGSDPHAKTRSVATGADSAPNHVGGDDPHANSKVYVSRGGGLFRVNANTIEIIDSDDEDQLIRDNSLACNPNGFFTTNRLSGSSAATDHLMPVRNMSGNSATPRINTLATRTSNYRTNAFGDCSSQPSSSRVQMFSSLPSRSGPFQPILSNNRTSVPVPAPAPTRAIATPGVLQRSSLPSGVDDSNTGFTENDFRTLVMQNSLTADAEKEAPTPLEMTVQLMPHQKRALEWMRKRERPTDLDEVVAVDDECLGGILADEQGLGKTLSMISVMLRNRPKVEMRHGLAMVNGRPLSDDDASDHSCADDGVSPQARRLPWRTLVVCPLSVLDQWRGEIIGKIREADCPSVCVYHGQKRNRESSELKSYDVVITTYATLVSEYPKVRKDLAENLLRKQANLELVRRPAGPLFQVHWHRVVLDEAHNIKNRSTDTFAASLFLKADVRWCLTGTPITNSVDDIYSLFCFIRYKFVPNYEAWNHRWKKRLEHQWESVRTSAFKQFQTLCGVVVLRRTKKDTIGGKPIIVLPKRNVRTLVSRFRDKEEVVVYNSVQEQSVVILDKYINSSSTGLYSSILVVLLRLRQACCHPFLVQYCRLLGNGGKGSERRFMTPYSDEELSQALELVAGGHSALDLFDEGARERIERLLHPPGNTESMATVWRGFGCVGCRKESQWVRGIFLGCGDLYCEPCSQLVKHRQQCFRCGGRVRPGDPEVGANEVRVEIHAKVILGCDELGGLSVGARDLRRWVKEELVRRKEEREHGQLLAGTSQSNDVSNDSVEKQRKKVISSISQSSTKIGLILEELDKTRQNGQNEKTLIFSQWTSMLDIVEFHVESHGHGSCRLDGSMISAERDQQIEEFKTNESKTVLLVSLHAGGTGLNLTAASRVILCDVWWNSSVEQQAIDRVHRIGQKRSVQVTKFRMEGTVEDRIYTICASKLERVSGALGESSSQSLGRRKLTMAELMSLFSGTAEDVANRSQSGSAARTAATNLLNYNRHNINKASQT